MTKVEFIAVCNQPEKLTRAVIAQVGGWKGFVEIAPDVASYGAAMGFSGFIYYTDTMLFAQRNRLAIQESLQQLADDLGESVIAVVKGFNCLRGGYGEDEIGMALYGDKGDKDDKTILNALAWYALEEVCGAYVGALGGR